MGNSRQLLKTTND